MGEGFWGRRRGNERKTKVEIPEIIKTWESVYNRTIPGNMKVLIGSKLKQVWMIIFDPNTRKLTVCYKEEDTIITTKIYKKTREFSNMDSEKINSILFYRENEENGCMPVVQTMDKPPWEK